MKLKAFAKVNLSLDITGKRADGYHTISSVFQSISLYDEIEIVKADGLTVGCSDGTLSGSDNLCFSAAVKFFEKAGISPNVKITIFKNIPLAAGLGGGSVDAAAVLKGLNVVFGGALSDDELFEIALSLGADVPFCLSGGTQLAEGIGEKLTPLTPNLDCYIVVAKKGEKGSTAEMYRELDKKQCLKRPNNLEFIKNLALGDIKTAFTFAYNCFCEVWGGETLEQAKEIGLKQGAVYCGVSGAGPSVVLVFENSSDAFVSANELEKAGFLTFVCQSVNKSVEIIE